VGPWTAAIAQVDAAPNDLPHPEDYYDLLRPLCSHIDIPFAAGGAFDVVGRIVGAHMSELLGQPIIIENVAGAAGIIGVKRVISARRSAVLGLAWSEFSASNAHQ
jgi:hypothetical protein